MSADCIDENTVVQYVEGLLDPRAARRLEAHVASCDACRALLAAAGEAAMEQEASLLPTRVHLGPERAEPGPLRSADGASTLRIGDTLLGSYVIRRFIGRGGMGTVFEAEHQRLARRFAIKVLTPGASESPVAVARLEREALITSRLAHPHIVEVIDFNHSDDGVPFIVMELLEGEPLAQRMARAGRITDLAFVVPVMRQTVSALYAAHGQGVVHRDLKPTNIFLCRNRATDPFVKVMDFGVSKVLGMQTVLTGDASLLGSPRYMAPEQAEGRAGEVDHRADIFSLGVVLFELLAGAPPFRGDSVPQTLFKIVYEKPVLPPDWQAVPRPLQRVVLRALSKDPAERPASMLLLWHELAAALREIGVTDGLADPTLTPLDADAAEVSPASWPRRPGFALRRGGRRAWLAGALAAVAVAGLLAALGLRGGPRRGASSAIAPAAVTPADAGSGRQDGSMSARPNRAGAADGGSSERLGRRPEAGSTKPDARAKRQVRVPPRRRRTRWGTLTVQSKSKADGRYLWATVFLDGKAVGQTAITMEKVSAGRHRLQVRRPGYRPRSRWVWIRPRHATRVTFELEPSGPAPAAAHTQ